MPKRSARSKLRSAAFQVAWAMRALPTPPPRRKGISKPAQYTKRQFRKLVKDERWGEPDGPEIEIELPIGDALMGYSQSRGSNLSASP